METTDNDQLYVIDSSCIWTELNDLFVPISLFSNIPIRVYVTFIRKNVKNKLNTVSHPSVYSPISSQSGLYIFTSESF